MLARRNFSLSSRTTPCNLCGQRRFERVAEYDRTGKPLATVICTTCGMISHEAIPAGEELRAFYRDRYRREYKGVVAPAAHRVIRAWNLGETLLHRLRPYLRAGERVLEIGAGLGATVKQFELAGFSASGVEPDRGSREYGRACLNASLEDAELDDLPQQPWYDVVLMHHVLEHLPAPREALEHIRRMLRLGGRAYIEVPNVAGPHAAPNRMFHAAHIYNFTPATLTALATSAGLAVKHVFTRPDEENIGLLLSPDSHALARVDYGDNYQSAVAAITRYSSLTYHLRPGYLLRRMVRGVRLLSDHVRSGARQEEIHAQCRRRPALHPQARAA